MSDRESRLPCRLVVDGTASGAWHMAVDEVLAESAADAGLASLRFYEWSEPTLSLGYFQRFREADLHAESRDCPRVRRATGGAAILHDRELTYCLALPLAHPLAADAIRLYLAVHEALRAALARFGLAAMLRGEEATQPGEPFLCFQRRMRGDVLVDGTKVCGSAQRRRRGAILQHGSFLLAASPYAPQLPGIMELRRKSFPPSEVIDGWSTAIAQRLKLSPTAGKLSDLELDRARTLTLEKYATASWNLRR
jgi:lipoate-protein ligase A